MAGSRNKMDTLSEFWCIRCGNRGIPIMREKGSIRSKGHRKALYCVRCRMVLNHIETRSGEEAQRFREEFAAGKYAEEAEQSAAYAKEHNL